MTFKLGLIVFALLMLAGMIGRRLGQSPPKDRGKAIEAARKCAVCGAYALAGASCARPGCPQA